MGKVRKEIGVLKLVRPGGIVELYRHPIKAAQVMERYPRHCVTRPDVFKFPYIVVKPESLLKLGQVFFIVPHHTIHRLLQSKGYRCHRQLYIPDDYESVRKKTLEFGHPLTEPNSHTRVVRKSSEKTLEDQMKEIDTSFFHQIVIPVENFQSKKQSNYLDQRKVMPRARQVADLSVEENIAKGSFKDGDYDSDEAFAAAVSGVSGCFPVKKKGGGPVEVGKGNDGRKGNNTTSLKPCLKKNQTSRKRSQLGPRVRFTLPDEDRDEDEKWDTDFSDF